MQTARTQLARAESADRAAALLDLVAAFCRHMLGTLAELIAHVTLALYVADARPLVASVAATALQGAHARSRVSDTCVAAAGMPGWPSLQAMPGPPALLPLMPHQRHCIAVTLCTAMWHSAQGSTPCCAAASAAHWWRLRDWEQGAHAAVRAGAGLAAAKGVSLQASLLGIPSFLEWLGRNLASQPALLGMSALQAGQPQHLRACTNGA